MFTFDYLISSREGLSRQILSDDKSGSGSQIENLSSTDTTKILVAKDSNSRVIFAHAVRNKGVGEDSYAVDCLVQDLNWLGYSHVILKSDNEKAVVNLLRQALKTYRITVAEESGEQVIVQDEYPTAYDHRSNGLAESAVKAVTAKVLMLKLDLEDCLQKTIPPNHPLICWITELAAWQLTTTKVGSDGMTAYQRIRGRHYAKRNVRFGERVLYKLPDDGPRARNHKLEAKWQYGFVLGYSNNTPNYQVLDEVSERMVTARSVQRIAKDDRWKCGPLERLRFTPQDMHKPSEPRTHMEDAPREGAIMPHF